MEGLSYRLHNNSGISQTRQRSHSPCSLPCSQHLNTECSIVIIMNVIYNQETRGNEITDNFGRPREGAGTAENARWGGGSYWTADVPV